MKLLILQIFITFAWISFLPAQDATYFNITTNQADEIRHRLDQYEKGILSLSAINEDAGQEGFRQLVGYYMQYSNSVSATSKLPIARSFAAFGLCSNAMILGKEFVNIYPNDSRGWRLLGGASYCMGFTNQAFNAYTKAVELGDTDCSESLAWLGLCLDRLDVIQSLLPKLMNLKNSPNTSEKLKMDTVSILLCYSLKKNQEAVFAQTLKGISMEEIYSDNAVKGEVNEGCKNFKGEEMQRICKSFEATAANISKTNSASRK